MSTEVHSVQRLRAYIGAIGTDSSGSIGSFTDLPMIEGTGNLTLTRDELDPAHLVQHIDEGRERVLGKRKATLSFSMNLAPTGTAATNSVSSVTSPLGMILKAVMGGEQLGEGSVAAAGSTSSVVNVSAGDGAQWANAGQMMGWTNSAGVVEWREVESRSTDAITLKRAFSGTPQTSDPLYNVATYYMTASPSTVLDFLVEGLESDDRWLLNGCQLEGGMTIALDLTGGQLPRVTFTFGAASWYSSSETSSSITGTLGTATYSAYNPIVGETGAFEVWTVGTSTYASTQLIPVSACTFEPHINFVAVTAPNGTNTVKEWKKVRNADSPVQGQFTALYEDLTWFNHRNSKTDLAVQYVAGTAAASALILSAPTVQALNPQRVSDAGGMAAQTVMWKGRRDTDVGSSTTDIAKSPFRIHLG